MAPTERRQEFTLEDFFAAAGAIGLLSAQIEKPDLDAVMDQALEFGRRMAAKARRQRKAH